MNRCTKKNCPMVGVSADCDLKDCPYRTEADQSKGEDLIKRSDAIKVVSHVAMECIDRKTRIELINAIPSADSTEYKRGKEDEKRWWSEHCAKCTDADRPQGEWIKDNLGILICSECKRPRRDNRINHIRFCNSCGARMRGDGNE